MIRNTTKEILLQLEALLFQLSQKEYTWLSNIIKEKSIGMHVRHIIELYQCLLNQYEEGIINYDKRPRNTYLENNIDIALKEVKLLTEKISNYENKPLKLIASFIQEQNITINTYYFRELLFNVDHTIHHFAIIRIIIENEFKHILLPEHFGYAFATIIHHKKSCVQ